MFSIKNWIFESAPAYLVAVAFLWAGLNKAFDFSSFDKALLGYAFLPYEVLRPLAWPLILAEVWIGVGLLFPSSRKISAGFAFSLLLLFTLIIGAEYLKGSSADCGCGSPILSAKKDPLHILQNLLLLALSSFVFTSRTRKEVNQNEGH